MVTCKRCGSEHAVESAGRKVSTAVDFTIGVSKSDFEILATTCDTVLDMVEVTTGDCESGTRQCCVCDLANASDVRVAAVIIRTYGLKTFNSHKNLWLECRSEEHLKRHRVKEEVFNPRSESLERKQSEILRVGIVIVGGLYVAVRNVAIHWVFNSDENLQARPLVSVIPEGSIDADTEAQMWNMLRKLVFDPELICVHLHRICLVQGGGILKVWANNEVSSVAVTFEGFVTLLSLRIAVFVTGREHCDGDSVFFIVSFDFLPVGEGETVNRLF